MTNKSLSCTSTRSSPLQNKNVEIMPAFISFSAILQSLKLMETLRTQKKRQGLLHNSQWTGTLACQTKQTKNMSQDIRWKKSICDSILCRTFLYHTIWKQIHVQDVPEIKCLDSLKKKNVFERVKMVNGGHYKSAYLHHSVYSNHIPNPHTRYAQYFPTYSTVQCSVSRLLAVYLCYHS